MDGAVEVNERISVSIENGVADVRLVRTDKMNALDDAMFSALVETGERLKSEPGLRAVVLSGEGRAFCAGLDMGNFGRMAQGRRVDAGPVEGGLDDRSHGIANRAQYAVWVWRDIPVPVIAAVHGGLLDLPEACNRYGISTDEFLEWERHYETGGLEGLRASAKPLH